MVSQRQDLPLSAPQLNIIAEKVLLRKCKPHTLAYCPTLDLVALATDDEELHIFRLNGQRVVGTNFAATDMFDHAYGSDSDDEGDKKKKQKGEVRCVAWRSSRFPS